jgi:hypothetical protein
MLSRSSLDRRSSGKTRDPEGWARDLEDLADGLLVLQNRTETYLPGVLLRQRCYSHLHGASRVEQVR